MSVAPIESVQQKSTIDSYQPAFASSSSKTTIASATPAMQLDENGCEVMIGTRESPSCPCCNRRQVKVGRETLDEPNICCLRNNSYMPSMLDEEEEEEEDILPGVLSKGTTFYPKRILVEGWLYKKGSGQDWMGSTGFKARWCRLMMARVDGYDVEVPLFCMYWYPSGTTTPSTVIVLDACVVIPREKEDKTLWNAYRFDVIHARQSQLGDQANVARTFSAPQKGRDAWVYAINQALLAYEKEKARAKMAAQARPLSPVYGGWACEDRHLNKRAIPPPPPPMERPTSPVSPRASLNIPRPLKIEPSRARALSA